MRTPPGSLSIFSWKKDALPLSPAHGLFHSHGNSSTPVSTATTTPEKKMSVPAASQLLEQCARVGVSYGLFLVLTDQGLPMSLPMLAVAGLVGGELASMIFSLLVLLWDYRKAWLPSEKSPVSPGTDMKEILCSGLSSDLQPASGNMSSQH